MRARRLVIGAAAGCGALLIVGGVLAAVTGRTNAAVARLGQPATNVTSTTISPIGEAAFAPETTVPADTPVQQQYDAGFGQGLSSASNKAMMARAETLELPSPAVAGTWPRLATSNAPDGWTREFVTGLLDINFSTQPRSSLASWIVAQTAPDLMPGIPTAFQNRALYVSVMVPSITGQPSPAPSEGQWTADAASGVRWAVSQLEVQLDPQWQSMVDAGWQPRDLRAVVEDVSGVLTITQAKTVTSKRFSLVVQVGSAAWHDGYGTVLVSNWEES